MCESGNPKKQFFSTFAAAEMDYAFYMNTDS